MRVLGINVLSMLSAVDWSARLRDGRTPVEGRVEIYIEGKWGTIVDSHWDLQDANVVCQQLGLSRAKVWCIIFV